MTKEKHLTIYTPNSTYLTTSQGAISSSNQAVTSFKFNPNSSPWTQVLNIITSGDVKRAEAALALYHNHLAKIQGGKDLYQQNMSSKNELAFKALGNSPLLRAIESENPNMVSLVIKSGAMPNLINNDHIEIDVNSPLIAIESVKSNRSQIKTILIEAELEQIKQKISELNETHKEAEKAEQQNNLIKLLQLAVIHDCKLEALEDIWESINDDQKTKAAEFILQTAFTSPNTHSPEVKGFLEKVAGLSMENDNPPEDTSLDSAKGDAPADSELEDIPEDSELEDIPGATDEEQFAEEPETNEVENHNDGGLDAQMIQQLTLPEVTLSEYNNMATGYEGNAAVEVVGENHTPPAVCTLL